MRVGEQLETLERLVRETWEKLVPSLDALDEDILVEYLHIGGPVSPYRVARRLNVNATSVYRRSRKLLEWRLLIPGLEPNSKDKLMVSVKGCLYLYIRGRLGLDGLVECYSRLWGLQLDATALLAFLHLLGLEAEKRKLTIRTITMCMPDEAAVHVLRYLRKAIEVHEELGLSFSQALDSVAYSTFLDRRSFREAIRLALRALTGTVLPCVDTGEHRIVVFASRRRVYPFVVWCRTPCRDYFDTLGVECPRAQRSVEKYIASRFRMIGAARPA